ncbi:MAG: hypothetical protein K9K65_11610 [Desulfarculaceae bacterium]|nr:hypothetical protein [Desulfarculaceae bacterium]MCF8048892.1 hypothetical protein [Desulfarculaceae bacterium]MCF8064451.1 hypothetical protein [Desulfarculaceae bacterium]MCF8098480.1 hypothetical protein [Desulfarculaceae bacterium]MCF8122301.1 hypothetical protein [Desulfarculaceae bacterium]
MGFTTWTALHDQLLDDLASGQWSVKSYTKGNHSVTYRSLKEFKEYIEWVREQADAEAVTVYGRTYLKPMGRNDHG